MAAGGFISLSLSAVCRVFLRKARLLYERSPLRAARNLHAQYVFISFRSTCGGIDRPRRALFGQSAAIRVTGRVRAVGRQPGALYACATRGIDQPAPSRPHCRTFLGAEAVPRPVSVDCPRGGRVSASATARAALRRARERRGRRTLLRADQNRLAVRGGRL